MKTIIIVLVLLFYQAFGLSQTIEKVGGQYIAQGVVEFDSISRPELFYRSLSWVSKAYRASKDAIKLNDLETHKIIIQGTFQTELFFRAGFTEHHLQLDFKDNRIRYIFSDMSYVPPGGKDVVYLDAGMLFKRWAINRIEDDLSQAISNLKDYVTNNPAPSNDW